MVPILWRRLISFKIKQSKFWRRLVEAFWKVDERLDSAKLYVRRDLRLSSENTFVWRLRWVFALQNQNFASRAINSGSKWFYTWYMPFRIQNFPRRVFGSWNLILFWTCANVIDLVEKGFSPPKSTLALREDSGESWVQHARVHEWSECLFLGRFFPVLENCVLQSVTWWRA